MIETEKSAINVEISTFFGYTYFIHLQTGNIWKRREGLPANICTMNFNKSNMCFGS